MSRHTVSLTIIALACSISLYADTYLKYKRTTDSYTVAGKTVPEATGESSAWIGSKQAAYDDGEGHRSIITYATKTLQVIDVGNKSYSTIKLDSINSMISKAIDDNMGDAESAAAMKAMMEGMMGSMMKGSMTVNKTSEQQKIGSWQCTKYLIDLKMAMGATTSESWITEQIKVDPSSFNMVKNGVMALMPGFGDIAKELGKIKGIPVKTVYATQSMNTTIKTTELLLESVEKTAPAGMYSIPSGYKQKAFIGE